MFRDGTRSIIFVICCPMLLLLSRRGSLGDLLYSSDAGSVCKWPLLLGPTPCDDSAGEPKILLDVAVSLVEDSNPTLKSK